MIRFSAIALLLFVLVATIPLPSASQAPFIVIVNSTNEVGTVSRAEVGRLFLRQTARWSNGSPVEPVDQPPGAVVRDAFSRMVHGRTTSSIVSHWRQQIFSGRGVPPPEQPSDDAVVRYVVGHRGGIGYVQPGATLRGARVLHVSGL